MGNNSGFTLIELILVTVIIGILAGMVTLTFAGRAEEARVKAALGDIKSYETAIESYMLDNNDKAPPDLKALEKSAKGRRYVRQVNTDPWGIPYVYKGPGQHEVADMKDTYVIYSAGPNGVDDGGTGDDVAPWNPEGQQLAQ